MPTYSALPERTAWSSAPHGLLDRRLGVEAVAVEDVDVVQAEPGQRLVERGQDVLARPAALAVGTGPHVVAGLGGDHQLVAEPGEVLGEEAAEVLLRAAVRRAVVVRQVEVRHAPVEGPAQDRPLGLLGAVGAEVLPEPQGQRRQLEPAAAGVAVVHRVVAVVGRLVVAHGSIEPPGGDSSHPPRRTSRTRKPLALESRVVGQPCSPSQRCSESAPRFLPTTSTARPPGASRGSQVQQQRVQRLLADPDRRVRPDLVVALVGRHLVGGDRGEPVGQARAPRRSRWPAAPPAR